MPKEVEVTAIDVEPQQAKTNLLGFSASKLGDFFEEIGEKRFRATQIIKWIHQMGECDLDQMTNISKDLRERLKSIAEIKLPEVVSCQDSVDGTRKWLIKVDGGSCIEMVYIPERERGTLCVSSQIGCALDCSFCATGKQGFNRDLTAAEIIGQLWIAADSFGQFEHKAPRRVTNVVMMGMGEPLANLDRVLGALNVARSSDGLGISPRRITISTVGLPPAIDRLANNGTPYNLAVSLHAPTDQLRNELVPVNQKIGINQVLDAADRYFDKSGRRLTFEYVLLGGVNDSTDHGRQLAKLLRHRTVLLNVIPYNPVEGLPYVTPSKASIGEFRQVLESGGVNVKFRQRKGDDIDAACGQLRRNRGATTNQTLGSRT